MSGKKIAICQDIKFLYQFLNHQTWLFIYYNICWFIWWNGTTIVRRLLSYSQKNILSRWSWHSNTKFQAVHPSAEVHVFAKQFFFLWLYKNAAMMRYQRPWDLSSCLSLSEYLSKVGKDYLQAFKKDTFLYNLKTVIGVKVQASDYVTWK